MLEESDNNYLDGREVYYIKKYDTYKNGYNSTIGGDYYPGAEIKYEESKVKELIKDIIETDISYVDLSYKHNIPVSIVTDIAHKRYRVRSWEGKENPRVKGEYIEYSEELIKGIVGDILENKTRQEIIEENKVSGSLVESIRKGLSHRDKWEDFSKYWERREEYNVNKKKKRNKTEGKKYGDEIYYKIKDKIVNTEDTYTKIAKDLGIKRSLVDTFSRMRIRVHVWGEDKNPRRRMTKYTKEDYEKVFKMYYIEGKSTHKIHQETDLRSLTSISYFVAYKRKQEWFDEFKEKYKEDIVREMKY